MKANSPSRLNMNKHKRLNPWPCPFWIAHRGAGKLAPENTLAAFKLGASFGYRAFECDVKLSRDGVPFLLHDADLKRTTGQHGLASERSWNELLQLDAGRWHSPTYAGEPLPSLETIARFCINGGHQLNIEIKPTPGDEAQTGKEVALAAARLWSGHPAPLLSSFQVSALAAAQQSAPELPRALLLDKLEAGWLQTALDLQCVAVVARHSLFDEAMVSALASARLSALAYTVNDADAAKRLQTLGLVGLITDAVDRFIPD
jgi:glycerophosphoryl diester phosphodiesterase